MSPHSQALSSSNKFKQNLSIKYEGYLHEHNPHAILSKAVSDDTVYQSGVGQ
jgi:hypothetical protein